MEVGSGGRWRTAAEVRGARSGGSRRSVAEVGGGR